MSKISDLMTALYGNQVQDLENAMRELYFRLDIDRMAGTQLDKIGTIVGQNRLGFSDDFYRILIKVKIGVHVSEGTIEQVLTAWKLLTNSTEVTLTERFPAKIKLTTIEYLGDDIFNFVKEYAQQILAGGVGVDEIIVVDRERFGFGSGFGGFGSNWSNSY